MHSVKLNFEYRIEFAMNELPKINSRNKFLFCITIQVSYLEVKYSIEY